MNFEKTEIYRERHPLGFPHKKGDNFGWFEIPSPCQNITLFTMAAPSDSEWQHVSVSTKHRPPNWQEMCFIKDLFWDEEDVVVQFHPKKSQYINNAKNCLHLWKYSKDFPTPPSILVGV
jgi:hypothetical protein